MFDPDRRTPAAVTAASLWLLCLIAYARGLADDPATRSLDLKDVERPSRRVVICLVRRKLCESGIPIEGVLRIIDAFRATHPHASPDSLKELRIKDEDGHHHRLGDFATFMIE